MAITIENKRNLKMNSYDRTKEKYSWQLPITYSTRKGDEFISHKAKFHLFKGYESVCKKWSQWGALKYETNYVFNCGEKYICKKCLEKYKELEQCQN